MTPERNVPLAPMTTLGIGGPARFFTRAASVDDVAGAVEWSRREGAPLLVLGGGSNLLVADEGFEGLVVRLELRGITVSSQDSHVMVKVAAGEPWDPFVAVAVENRWGGIECLSGIPGLVGATPIQNVGAYGQDVSETIVRVDVFDTAEGIVKTLANRDCRFAYRSSIFKSDAGRRFIVVGVTYRLQRDGIATVRYPELRDYLSSRGSSSSDLKSVRDAVIAIRRRKGMVIDLNDPDTRSDGSFFMNPILTREEYDRFARLAPDAPHFPAGEDVKLSAAWLIERAGFQKGYAHGNVGLSSKHTLAIINRGGGTAREVIELVRLIQGRVREKFGVELHPEPTFAGF